jgi:hypothetical protein
MIRRIIIKGRKDTTGTRLVASIAWTVDGSYQSATIRAQLSQSSTIKGRSTQRCGFFHEELSRAEDGFSTHMDHRCGSAGGTSSEWR